MVLTFTYAVALACTGAVLADPASPADPYVHQHHGDQPFLVVNQNPLIALHAVPKNRGTAIPGKGQFHSSLSYSVASHFEIDTPVGEQIFLDGESERLSLNFAWGMAPNWALGLDIPFIRHSSGYLDSLIIDWHDWFNLPQNGRDELPRDVLRFSYDNGVDNILLADDVSGLGDIEVYLAHQLVVRPKRAITLRGYVKLPTGDAGDLLGSEGWGAGASIHVQQRLGQRLNLSGWVGLAHVDAGEILPDLTRRWVAAGGVGAAWRLNAAVSLKLQWDVNSQVYENTRLQQLNEVAYLMSFGGTVKLNKNHWLDLIVVENYPHPQISPDVAFRLAWRWMP